MVWLTGEGGLPAAPDGLHRPPCHRDIPDGRRHVARAEGEEGGPHGGHPHRGLRPLLDPLLHHGAHRAPLLLQHPAHLEEHLPLAGLLQLFLQPAHLHGLQQELQQRSEEPVLSPAMRPRPLPTPGTWRWALDVVSQGTAKRHTPHAFDICGFFCFTSPKHKRILGHMSVKGTRQVACAKTYLDVLGATFLKFLKTLDSQRCEHQAGTICFSKKGPKDIWQPFSLDACMESKRRSAHSISLSQQFHLVIYWMQQK